MSKAKKRRRGKRKQTTDTPIGGGRQKDSANSSQGPEAGESSEALQKGSFRKGLGIFAFVVLVAVISFGINGFFFSHQGEVSISYPFDGSVFPPEIVAPTIWWEDGNQGADRWHVSVEFEGGHDPIQVDVDTTAWSPDDALWESIKEATLDHPARITVSSLATFAGIPRTLSSQTISISTSPDSVGAPIFFREVPLPFLYATEHLTEIKWRMGDIASKEPPPVVLSDLPACGNCHSFSTDGNTLGMDVDVANDKGAYILTPFEPETPLSKDRIFSWNDYYPVGGSTRTFGLLARVSPDGRYVVGGMKDRAVFIPRPDLEYSQLFFPVSGSLAYYDRETREIEMLPGANDDAYVQSNAAWTADGQQVTFARSPAAQLTSTPREHLASLSLPECAEVLGGEQFVQESRPGYTRFLFDLYSVPFNGGRGGEPVPVPGASGNGKSNYFPKYSPDGKWIVFDQAESFMLLMPDSRLYIMPAEGGEPRLMNANRESMNSWHSWSPNSKWLVFSSKLFSPYTQLFLTHIDENGMDTPPVLIESFRTPDRAINIPEFVNIEPGSERRMAENFVDDHTYLRHGLRLEEFGRIEEAQAQYLESLRLNPENSDSRLALALTYAKNSQFEEAEETIGAISERNTNYHRALYFLGGMKAQQGDFPAAVEAYQRSLGTGNGDRFFQGNVHFNLGRAFYILEDYDAAVESFQFSVGVDPNREDAYIHLGNIKLRQGHPEAAIQNFERAYDLNPSLDWLLKAVDDIKRRSAIR